MVSCTIDDQIRSRQMRDKAYFYISLHIHLLSFSARPSLDSSLKWICGVKTHVHEFAFKFVIEAACLPSVLASKGIAFFPRPCFHLFFRLLYYPYVFNEKSAVLN